MKITKGVAGVILMTVMVLAATPVCQAQTGPLKMECEVKAEKAAALIHSLGQKDAFEKITDPDGEFVGKKSHVFCIKLENGALLAHKVDRFIGVNMHYYRDADQNRPYQVILKRARTEASGWISYYTRGSGPDKRETPGLKHMHFLKVPGKDIVLCCGYFED